MSDEYPVLATEWIYRGKVVSLRRDTLRMGDGSAAEREVVEHPGAVAVVAVDDADRVVLINQYRHPVRARLDELPAGLLDVSGEDPLAAARRELAEEVALQADDWRVLVDLYSSPGFSDEAIRIYLARGLHDAGRPEGFVVEHEEAGIAINRVPLEHAAHRVLIGEITNSSAVGGILAAVAARGAGWDALRPADAPWLARPPR